METITKKVKNNLSHLITGQNPSVLAAFSGGIDSRCLLDILLSLKDEMRLDIHVAYINHNLRGVESQAEELFVTELINGLGLPLYKKSIDSNFWDNRKRESVEMAARRIRYEFFSTVIKEKNIGFIATAHNLNDNIETFLLKVIRAGGVDTLSSIPYKNGNIIRPLLNVSRNEIEYFVKEKNLKFVEDSTNSKNIYKRNIIRNSVIPVLSELEPGFDRNFEKMFSFFKEEKIFVNRVIRNMLKKVVVYRSDSYCAISKEKFIKLGIFVKKHFIKTILRNIGFPAKPDRFMFSSLLSTKKTAYNKNNLICLERGNIVWFINKALVINFNEEIHVNGFPFFHETAGKTFEIIKEKSAMPGKSFSFDGKKIKFPLVIRGMKKSDLLNTTADISLLKILKNMKVPSVLFTEVIVISDSNKNIGFILNDIFRVSQNFYFEQGKDILTLSVKKK